MSDIKQRIVLITGSTRGIGLATAKEFLKNGDKVAVFCRHEEHGKDAARALEEHGKREDILITHGDVGVARDADRIIQETLDKFGAINVLVNNAGQAVWKPVGETSESEWDAILDTNLKGAFLFMRRAVPLMREQGGGVIINVSSGLGARGQKNFAPYAASKFGLIGLTQVVAEETQGTPIKIYAILPGAVATKLHFDLHPQEDVSKMMTPEYMGGHIFTLAKGVKQSGASIEVYH